MRVDALSRVALASEQQSRLSQLDHDAGASVAVVVEDLVGQRLHEAGLQPGFYERGQDRQRNHLVQRLLGVGHAQDLVHEVFFEIAHDFLTELERELEAGVVQRVVHGFGDGRVRLDELLQIQEFDFEVDRVHRGLLRLLLLLHFDQDLHNFFQLLVDLAEVEVLPFGKGHGALLGGRVEYRGQVEPHAGRALLASHVFAHASSIFGLLHLGAGNTVTVRLLLIQKHLVVFDIDAIEVESEGAVDEPVVGELGQKGGHHVQSPVHYHQRLVAAAHDPCGYSRPGAREAPPSSA